MDFETGLVEDQHDYELRLVYSDWLEEQGRSDEAVWQRLLGYSGILYGEKQTSRDARYRSWSELCKIYSQPLDWVNWSAIPRGYGTLLAAIDPGSQRLGLPVPSLYVAVLHASYNDGVRLFGVEFVDVVRLVAFQGTQSTLDAAGAQYLKVTRCWGGSEGVIECGVNTVFKLQVRNGILRLCNGNFVPWFMEVARYNRHIDAPATNIYSLVWPLETDVRIVAMDVLQTLETVDAHPMDNEEGYALSEKFHA